MEIIPLFKKRYCYLGLIGFVILVIIISILITAFSKVYYLNLGISTGVWWWNINYDPNIYLPFLKENGITEIYIEDARFSEETSAFIKDANSKNIKVFLLQGLKDWILDHTKLTKIIEKYRIFNKNYPNTTYSGLHLDVEPHQFDDFQERRVYYLEKYVQFVYEIVNENPDINIDFDVPFWLHDEIEYNGQTKMVYKHLIDIGNRIFIMSYRDTAEAIVKCAIEELEYAKEKGKMLFLCVETKSSEGEHVSFQEDGKKVMYEELRKLGNLVNQTYGVSIHHVKTWYDLKN
jgi:hypothetical protein